MTRPLMSYLAPYIADGDPLPDTVTVNAADLQNTHETSET
jgi:hypothetical protein